METIETAIDEAMRASEEAKRSAYAAVVVNSLRPSRPTDEERLLFLDVVGRCRAIHLRLLGVLMSVKEPPQDYMMVSAKTVLEPMMSGVDLRLVGLAWNDLYGWGFVDPSWSGLAMGSKDVSILSRYVTALGTRFVEFVTVGSSEVPPASPSA